MRILLLTDTHGRLDHIDALAAANACDAVIHAGDLGFYDEQSLGHLSGREISLRIVHSDLPDNDKKEALQLAPDRRESFVRDRLPLSQLPEYLSGKRRFATPVLAVWGNHEDTEVVKKFYSGDYTVPNLHVLHEKSPFRMDVCHVFGVGGNFLLSSKLFQKPIGGGGGRVWATLSQYPDLISVAETEGAGRDLRILVSHVSPGKEAFVSLVGACVGASVVISGHMGPPFAMCWNEFAIREPEESTRRLERCVADISNQAEGVDQAARESANRLRDCFARCQRETVPIGRGTKAPRWYRDMLCINLPDFDAGHAVLAIEQGLMRLETHSTHKRCTGHDEPTDAGDP